MVLHDKDTSPIVNFVKKEPRSIQEIARFISKSWLTADSYVSQIEQKTGLISTKTFRKGSRGALKVVFYNTPDRLLQDEVKEKLFNDIKIGKRKYDFDFMELFQNIPDNQKKVVLKYVNIEKSSKSKLKSANLKNSKSNNSNLNNSSASVNSDKSSISLANAKLKSFEDTLASAKYNVYFFSGNLSFVNESTGGKNVLDLFEKLLQRKVRIKILCRVNFASIKNIDKISRLLTKYPDLLELRHCYHPLRGFIVDEEFARFTGFEQSDSYRPGELDSDVRIYYELYSKEWIDWLSKVFWNLFRISINYSDRMKELDNISKI